MLIRKSLFAQSNLQKNFTKQTQHTALPSLSQLQFKQEPEMVLAQIYKLQEEIEWKKTQVINKRKELKAYQEVNDHAVPVFHAIYQAILYGNDKFRVDLTKPCPEFMCFLQLILNTYSINFSLHFADYGSNDKSYLEIILPKEFTKIPLQGMNKNIYNELVPAADEMLGKYIALAKTDHQIEFNKCTFVPRFGNNG